MTYVRRNPLQSAVGALLAVGLLVSAVVATTGGLKTRNAALARQGATEALALSPGRDVTVVTALAMARAGDTARAQNLVQDLEKKYPSNTVLKVYWIPTIRAAMELNHGNSSGSLD